MKKIVKGIHEFQQGDYQQHQDFFQSLAQGQSPRALFITCSDSRIDPSRLTRTEPGELFILRTAGNIVPPYGAVTGGEAATIEYAIAALGITDIIVCGHSHCGAMSGLLSLDKLDALPSVKAYLGHAEATRRVIEENYQHVTDFDQKLHCTVEENVLIQLENLRTHPAVAAALGRKKLELHGWVYRFESGEVFAFDPTKRDFALLEDVMPAISDGMRTTNAS
ncbi:MAG: carbonic anhydrase [Aureliella sp.]